ncbi:DUF1992 domain-containing protein [Nocardia sp. NBC_01388]|uniref:DnaJ family domain-containing protein n=1 Tax=Nocardia sp. NBC_01388 TaxID=2903596 RepID=UPI0032503619
MTERKPPGLTFESWIDRQIREATERGEFDQLPGAGQPIPAGPADENWWVLNLLKREGLRADALLPEPIVLRREREQIQDTVRDVPSEREVRETVAALNERIVQYMRNPVGPRVPITPLCTDDVVDTWRTDRDEARAARTQAIPASTPPADHPWWRRLFGR